jgi:hypothetical protein
MHEDIFEKWEAAPPFVTSAITADVWSASRLRRFAPVPIG